MNLKNQGRIAVIDIGSNTVRLVLYDQPKRLLCPMFNEKAQCGLGQGIAKSGKLNQEGVKAAFKSLARFIALAGIMRASRIDLVATAAVRDAKDGPAFAAKVEKKFGLKVEVLSGAEEARLAAMGLLCGMPDADGILGDLGGGSLDLALIREGVFTGSATLPLGHLRLAEEATGNAAPRAGPEARPRTSHAGEIAARHLASVRNMMIEGQGRDFYAVGGSWRSLARIFIEQTGHPLHVVDNFTIPSGEALRMARLIGGLSQGAMARISSISPKRRPSLPYAAKTLEMILTAARPKRVVFSSFGVREGQMLKKLPARLRKQDPLISGCLGVSRQGGRFPIDGEEMLAWMSPLFRDAPPVPRRLMLAACLISDIGWNEHPDYRAEHALRRALRLPFAGLFHGDRAILGLTVYVRYNGDPREPELAPLHKLLKAGQMEWVETLGLALRLAYALSGGAHGLLSKTKLRRSGKKLFLELPKRPNSRHVLDGEAVERRLKNLANSQGLKGKLI